MTSLLSRFTTMAFAGSLMIVWPFSQGCAHPAHSSALRGGAPLLNEDSPRANGGTNPNAPYLMKASTPQLAHRSEASGTAVNPCDSKNLTVTEIAAAVNGKYRAVKLAFDNDGLAPCRIGGYPTVALLDQTGTPVAHLAVDRVTDSALSAQLSRGAVPAAATVAKPDAQITIAPRGEAWFEVGWSTGEGCPVVSRISVSAPESSESFTVNHPLTVCEGRVQITTLHADQEGD
ncbi:MAG TPA: DUF4232 domain-containing protein [Alloacidobacterium sp.]|nr:DUF4232 domain-containing protein [Alloacidobacterium sp.]